MTKQIKHRRFMRDNRYKRRGSSYKAGSIDKDKSRINTNIEVKKTAEVKVRRRKSPAHSKEFKSIMDVWENIKHVTEPELDRLYREIGEEKGRRASIGYEDEEL